MAIPSEVRRVQAAIDNNNHKELEWSLWYARMRQSVPSARPADVKYWSAVEQQVDEILNPPPPQQNFPTRKKKKENRGLGLSPLPGETAEPEPAATGALQQKAAGAQHLEDPNFKSMLQEHRDILTAFSRPMKRKPGSEKEPSKP
jgi:hypothetical protein